MLRNVNVTNKFNISGYIIFYNNQDTIKESIESLMNQTIRFKQIILIDDCSTDNSFKIASSYNVEIIKNKKNMGRGYSRSIAHKLTKSELILSLDATNIIPNDFVEKSFDWFLDAEVGAVYGRITQQDIRSTSDCWRSIHLFNDDVPQKINVNHTFISYGSIVRKESYNLINGYNESFTFNEDVDLGKRLINKGFKTIFDPSLHVFSISSSNLFKTLERYSRWNSGSYEKPNLNNYAKNIYYSIKCMCLKDFRLGNYDCILISLLCPHFQFLYQIIKYLNKLFKSAIFTKI